MIYYRWGYSWGEILKLYKSKQSEWVQKRSADYDFLVSLAKAALGGKSSSGDEVGLDDGEGIDEMSEEDMAGLKLALGKDFHKQFPQYADEEQ